MEKPPLGIKPRWLHRSERIKDIFDAMWRYSIAEKPIPVDWIIELNDLVKDWPDYAMAEAKIREEACKQ